MQDAAPRFAANPFGAFLAIWNDFDPGRDDEYNRWHTFEHVPERLRVEGIVAAVRYWAPEREQKRYFTLYELESIAVLGGAGYTRLVRRPSDWSARMRPSFRNFVRYPCTGVAAVGAGLGGCVATFRFRVPHELDEIQATPVLQALLETSGITRLRLGHADTSVPYPVGSDAAEAQPGEAYVLIIEGLERAALDRKAPRVADTLRQDFEAAGPILWESYAVAFAQSA
jgi:hypothetical protein